MVPVPGHWDRGGVDGGLLEEPVETEAGVPLSSVRIEDPDRRPPARRAGAVTADDHLRSLADDIPSEADPRAPGELEANAGRFADGCDDVLAEPRRLQDDERDPGPPSEAGEAAQAIGDAGLARQPSREIDDEEIDRSTGEQRAGNRQPFVGVGRRQDDEPLRADPTSDGLNGIEGGGEVQPGHDRAGCLGLGDQPQSERRPAAREVAAQREAHAARQPAGAKDGIDGREARRQHAHRRLVPVFEWPKREGPDDLARGRRGGRAPARSEGRESRRDVGGKLRHRAQYRTSVRMNQAPDGPYGMDYRPGPPRWGRLLDSLSFGGRTPEHRMGM